LFKEIIQNADDAGATEVKFILDSRPIATLSSELIDDDTVDISQFVAPSLLTFNNAPFTRDDWDNVQNLHLSSKANNPQKVGKFGIGFNSVYHITDLPVIVSEDYCGFLDPQEQIWKKESGQGFKLSYLSKECPEVLRPFDGICGFTKYKPNFPNKTFIRFPLRKKASKLSRNLYTISKVQELLEALKQELSYILLFLRSVCSIEVSLLAIKGNNKPLFKVTIKPSDLTKHKAQQSQLLSILQQPLSDLQQPLSSSSQSLQMSSSSTMNSSVFICDIFTVVVTSSSGSKSTEHQWAVMNRIGSKNSEIQRLASELNVFPCVGTAIEIARVTRGDGHVFCMLPLPTEDLTPFPVHVNGTFAVNRNRRSLMWEAQERKDNDESLWNKLLVEKCLPQCYFKLIETLVTLPGVTVDLVYSCWPLPGRVGHTLWKGMLDVFYEMLFESNVAVYTKAVAVYTKADSGKWISIDEAVFIDNDDDDITPAVTQVCFNLKFQLVELQDDQWDVLKWFQPDSLQKLKPVKVRGALKKKLRAYNYMSTSSKLDILKYCMKDSCVYSNLVGLELLPLMNGTFITFPLVNRFINAKPIAYLYERSTSFLLPGLEGKIVKVDDDHKLQRYFRKICSEDYSMIKLLDQCAVSKLLKDCDASLWPRGKMEEFWKWLRDKDLKYFKKTSIVPIKDSNNLYQLAKENGIVCIDNLYHLNDVLIAGLEKCAIKYTGSRYFNYVTHPDLRRYLYHFNPGDILDALKEFDLSEVVLSGDEANAIQIFIAQVAPFTEERLRVICGIPMFKVIQQSQLVSLQSIRSNSHFIAMKGHCEFDTSLIPDYPLIIDEKYNHENFLRCIHGVKFVNGVEYLTTIAFPQIENRMFSGFSFINFMKSVLSMRDDTLRQLTGSISKLPFVPTQLVGTYESPCNLFDPEIPLCKVLLQDTDKLPDSTFSSFIRQLRRCGLKVTSDLTASDILPVISSIANSDAISQQKYSKAVSLLKLFRECPGILDEELVNGGTTCRYYAENAKVYNMLPVVRNPPQNYPKCLEWKGTNASNLTTAENLLSVMLADDVQSSSLPLIAGSSAIFTECVPLKIINSFNYSDSHIVTAIVNHFKSVIDNKQNIIKNVLKDICLNTYRYLNERLHECSPQLFKDISDWIWISHRSVFVKPSQVAVSGHNSFLVNNLEPHIFILPASLHQFKDLFIKCGVQPTLSTGQILSVLFNIKNNPQHFNGVNAWKFVKAILEWVADNPNELTDEDKVLIPIQSTSKYPQLEAKENVAFSNNKFIESIARSSKEQYQLIHSKLAHLASRLGLKPLADHLDITQDVFDDAGQYEPLVTRLCNILKEYKDGLTIMKEMIQNADDALATEVNILYDNRHHKKDQLLFKGMSEASGPALIVHNNSSFTDEDFENITKLAAATKANKRLKIGKFGVGFCSVYHITDVPSFVSGEWFYVFDPTLQHLKDIVINENRPGKRVKYLTSIVRNTNQMLPYEGLFGFDSSKTYKGTLFRFPFRSFPSQISSTVYNKPLIEQLKKDLANNGSRLLLFLQNVKRITFSTIKNNQPVVELSIECTMENDIKKIVIKEKSKKVEHWLVSSSVEDYNESQSYSASVSCQLIENKDCFKVAEIEGNVFCYLPLGVPSTGLPVHVSANFAVMSNRSGIWTESSSSTPATDKEVQWNKVLISQLIPKTYIDLLEKLKGLYTSGYINSYEFYSIWPSTAKLQIKPPWESLVSGFYECINRGNLKLTYSETSKCWLTVGDSQFFDYKILNIENNLPDFVLKVASTLKYKTVNLPPSYLDELKKHTSVKMLTEDIFIKNFFISIKSFGSQEHKETRNRVLYKILLTFSIKKTVNSPDANLMRRLLLNNQCIPCTPDGTILKKANQLIDSSSKLLQKLFAPKDQMFPIRSFMENEAVYSAMIDLGLLRTWVPWDIVIKCASSVEESMRRRKNDTLEYVGLLLKVIGENIECNIEINDTDSKKLKKIPFIPVLSKPKDYILPWKGDSSTLFPSFQLMRYNMEKGPYLFGTQRVLVNFHNHKNGGCGYLTNKVADLLGILTEPSLEDVLANYQCLIDTVNVHNLHRKIAEIEKVCKLVYEFINKQLTNNKIQHLSRDFVVWSGTSFISPMNIAKSWKQEGPTLYNIPRTLASQGKVISALKIPTKFDIKKLIETLSLLKNKFNGPLPADYRKEIDAIISEFNTHSFEDNDQYDDVYLPDESYTLHRSINLSYNDTAWLQPSNDVVLVHSNVNRKTAISLGVKPFRSKYLERYVRDESQQFEGVSFGQHEKLSERIKNILRDYPLDVTFLKELLQNADDARANEICIILDKRRHSTDYLPSDNWKKLQGPALLVWNDKEFTDEDLEGIQRLGLGSKRDNDESIGQYGIGFNMVYHITDCPSLLTCKNILCVFDPLCQYVPGATSDCPGRRFDNLQDEFWRNMSSLSSTYFQSNPLPSQPPGLTKGSLFRFPLRTNGQSDLLLLAGSYVSVQEMEDNLAKWINEIKDSLLFLNSLRKLSYYIIEDSRRQSKFDLIEKYEVHLTNESKEKCANFREKLTLYKTTLEPFTTTYTLTVNTSSTSSRQKWLIQQGIGDVNKSPPPTELAMYDKLKVLPKHGIAAHFGDAPLYGKAFCFLPLPVSTRLPVHINGQFALSSNRRSIWSGDIEDSRTEWNQSILEAIASSYAEFLKAARSYFVGLERNIERLNLKVKKYYSLFPVSNRQHKLEGDWSSLAKMIFDLLYINNMPILLESNNWEVLHNEDMYERVFFKPLEMSDNVLLVLKRLNMKFTQAPHFIYTSFSKYNHQLAIADPQSVFAFYTEFYSKILTSGVPCSISDSPFLSVENFRIFLKYILTMNVQIIIQNVFLADPFDFPLLLTADDQLTFFVSDCKVLQSRFSSIFPCSLRFFLHPELLDLDISSSYFLNADESEKVILQIISENLNPALQQPIASSSHISEQDLTSLWDCLDSDIFFKRHRDKVVKMWALIPAANQPFLYTSSSPIRPITTAGGLENEAYRVFKDIGVPVLKSSMPWCVEKYCPSMNDYNAVLDVVYNIHCEFNSLLNINEVRINTILRYFSKTSFRSDGNILKKIISLPLFITVHGCVISLIDKSVYLWPCEGFCDVASDKWASDDKVFLSDLGNWRELCQNEFSIIGKSISAIEVYSQIIFVVFGQLDRPERMEHILYIRDYLFDNAKHESKLKNDHRGSIAKEFITNLKNVNCLESPNNPEVLLPISAFADHTVEIIATFSSNFLFLNNEYRDEKWMKFFRAVGLKKYVTSEEFKEFCTYVSMFSVNDALNKANVLIDYLFSSKAQEIHKNKEDMAEVGNIPFVPPDKLLSHSWIAPSCSSKLVKLNESVLYKHASLVWTVKPVICLPDDDDIIKDLGVHARPNTYDVCQNIINISRTSLASFQLFSKYKEEYISTGTDDRVSITNVIVDNFYYLQQYDTKRLKELRNIPCIPVEADINKFVLVFPLQVVQTIGSDSNLRPYISELPNDLRKLFTESFDMIGINHSVELDNVRFMLEVMNEESSNFDPNVVRFISAAMLKLFDLLKNSAKGTIENKLGPLYLPTFDESLKLSTKLIFLDTDRYLNGKQDFDLLQSTFSIYHIPLGTSSNKYFEKDLFFLLPKVVRPCDLALVGKEVLDDSSAVSNNTTNKLLVHFKNLQGFSSSALIDALSKAILKGSYTILDSEKLHEFVSTVITMVKNLQLKCMKNLTTLSLLENTIIGKCRVAYFLQKSDHEQGGTLYIDESITKVGKPLLKDIAKKLCIESSRVINEMMQVGYYLTYIRIISKFLGVQNQDDFDELMEDFGIEVDRGRSISDDVTFKVGQAISARWIPFLDNDMLNILFPQEFVGYEIEEDKFVWAIILYPIGGHSNPLEARYRIQITEDEEDNGIEVSVLDIYKIITAKSTVSHLDSQPEVTDVPSTSSQLIVSEVTTGPSQGSRSRNKRSNIGNSDDILRQLRRKICDELKKIWTLSGEDRRKAIRRMYFNYHPDKANDREKEIYEKLFKFMLQQIDRLENNLPLSDPDNESFEEPPTYTQFWSQCYSQWDTSTHRRTRPNTDQSYTQSSFNFSQTFKDQDEADRWFRQAEADFTAMQFNSTAISTYPNLSSHVIFMAHQVMEKSLKAAMYKFVGLSSIYLTKHHLSPLALALASVEGEFSTLHGLVSSMESYYLDTRYPNRHSLPKAPVDVYTPHQAEVCIENAKKVYNLIKRFI
jgi:sacsin